MHHAARVRVDPTLTELDVRRSSAARFLVSGILGCNSARIGSY